MSLKKVCKCIFHLKPKRLLHLDASCTSNNYGDTIQKGECDIQFRNDCHFLHFGSIGYNKTRVIHHHNKIPTAIGKADVTSLTSHNSCNFFSFINHNSCGFMLSTS